MLTIDFISGTWASSRGRERRDELDSASLADLQFHYFLGDVRLSDEHGVVFQTSFGWVGALDFVISLFRIGQQLGTAQEASLDYRFKQSDDWISVLRVRDAVFLSCSFAPGIARAPFKDFVNHTCYSLGSMLDQFAVEYPGLVANPDIVRLRKELHTSGTSQ
jgi:hypothetical protein